MSPKFFAVVAYAVSAVSLGGGAALSEALPPVSPYGAAVGPALSTPHPMLAFTRYLSPPPIVLAACVPPGGVCRFNAECCLGLCLLPPPTLDEAQNRKRILRCGSGR
jgi:hypothetical protein